MLSCVPVILLAMLPFALSMYGPLEYAIGLSDNAKLYIMCEHNRIRTQIATGKLAGTVRTQPKAANMQALCWCEELVPKAQQHASNCSGPPHDPRAGRSTANFQDVGQNYMDCGKTSPIDESIQAFTEEFNGFELDTNYCDTANAGRAHECGHYTQLSWAQTQCLGCAYDSCDGKRTFGRFVCNYGPGGNIAGKQPYVKGEPCTQCNADQLCLNNALCSDKLICSDTQRCSPPPSSSAASSTCVDTNPSCAAYRDSPAIRVCEPTSPYSMFAQQSCRATCNFCGGVSPGKVCAMAFNVSSGICDRMTTIDRKECADGNGLKYAGVKSVTKSGNTCLAWSANDPGTNYYNDFEFPDRSKRDASNYCRNPASSGASPWCYTTNPNVRWEYCDVPAC